MCWYYLVTITEMHQNTWSNIILKKNTIRATYCTVSKYLPTHEQHCVLLRQLVPEFLQYCGILVRGDNCAPDDAGVVLKLDCMKQVLACQLLKEAVDTLERSLDYNEQVTTRVSEQTDRNKYYYNTYTAKSFCTLNHQLFDTNVPRYYSVWDQKGG